MRLRALAIPSTSGGTSGGHLPRVACALAREVLEAKSSPSVSFLKGPNAHPAIKSLYCRNSLK